MMKILKFGKESCAPCVELDKWLEKQGITDYEKINPEEDWKTADQYDISSIPTLLLINKNNEVVKRCVGAVSKNPTQYETLITLYQQKND